METNQKLLQRSLSSMKGADFLHLPVAVMHAANSSNVWYVQAKASSLGDVTWKNDSETNLVHQPLRQVWVLYERSDQHLLLSHPHASNIFQYSAGCMRTRLAS